EDQEIYVTVTFHYAYGVENVSFSIFDIDENDSNDSNVGYTDKIYLLGKNLKGKWVAPSDIDDYSANEQQSSGTNIYVRGNNSASDTTTAGNADYEFTGTNVINSFSFSYGNDANAPNNPGNQWIALHDIKYTPKIPEWHPGLIASFACLMLVGARRFFF
ncbi:MAG: hypothetical protein K0Q55_1225, partial [Verrucomicrobia bacterium]|nr:hypothetical protein [Verrucomicrobiota bacterium]